MHSSHFADEKVKVQNDKLMAEKKPVLSIFSLPEHGHMVTSLEVDKIKVHDLNKCLSALRNVESVVNERKSLTDSHPLLQTRRPAMLKWTRT